jgi:hypothetical protein
MKQKKMTEYNSKQMDHSVTHDKPKVGKKSKLPSAPTKLFGLPNADKDGWHESYDDNSVSENLARYPHPFRACVLGRVNSGKSLVAKFILMAHQAHKPKFQNVYVVHGSNKSEEYDCIEPTDVFDDIPSYELFRFGSTHHNISIILLHQVFVRVPKIARDCSNIFIIYRPVDLDSLDTVGRRVGLKKEQVRYIFNELMPHYRDSLCVNLIPGAPHKYLKNVYEPLELPFDV